MPTTTAPDHTPSSRSEVWGPLICLALILVVLVATASFEVDPLETGHSRAEIRAAREDAVWDHVPDSMTVSRRFASGAQHEWVPMYRPTSSVSAHFDSAQSSLPIALGSWRVAAVRAGWRPASAWCDQSARDGRITFTRTLADRPAELVVERTYLHAPRIVVRIEVGDDPSSSHGPLDPAEMERCAPRS